MTKKKKVQKMSADKGLAIEQFDSLDTEFYNTYPREFFLNKLEEVLLRIAQPERVSAALDGMEIEIGKLSAIYRQNDAVQMARYAKIELYETYIHCMESFFRLFLARASNAGCDWLAMAKLTISDYHKALVKIKNGDFNWINNRITGDIAVVYALTGIEEKDNNIDPETIQNWKSWISHCAYELSEVKAYNAYKHGLTLHASVGGFTMQPEGEDIELGRHGDVISYLTTSEKANRFVWVKKTEFTDLDDIAYKIYVFGQLICSMIETGRFQHGNKEKAERWYPAKEITPDFSHKEVDTDIQSIFQMLSSYSIELLYYSDKTTAEE